MYLIHIHKAPSYLKDIVTPIASVCSRGGLRSASNARYEQPRMRLKFGQRCYSYAAPAAWNTLPPSLQQLTNTPFTLMRFKPRFSAVLQPQRTAKTANIPPDKPRVSVTFRTFRACSRKN